LSPARPSATFSPPHTPAPRGPYLTSLTLYSSPFPSFVALPCPPFRSSPSSSFFAPPSLIFLSPDFPALPHGLSPPPPLPLPALFSPDLSFPCLLPPLLPPTTLCSDSINLAYLSTLPRPSFTLPPPHPLDPPPLLYRLLIPILSPFPRYRLADTQLPLYLLLPPFFSSLSNTFHCAPSPLPLVRTNALASSCLSFQYRTPSSSSVLTPTGLAPPSILQSFPFLSIPPLPPSPPPSHTLSRSLPALLPSPPSSSILHLIPPIFRHHSSLPFNSNHPISFLSALSSPRTPAPSPTRLSLSIFIHHVFHSLLFLRPSTSPLHPPPPPSLALPLLPRPPLPFSNPPPPACGQVRYDPSPPIPVSHSLTSLNSIPRLIAPTPRLPQLPLLDYLSPTNRPYLPYGYPPRHHLSLPPPFLPPLSITPPHPPLHIYPVPLSLHHLSPSPPLSVPPSLPTSLSFTHLISYTSHWLHPYHTFLFPPTFHPPPPLFRFLCTSPPSPRYRSSHLPTFQPPSHLSLLSLHLSSAPTFPPLPSAPNLPPSLPSPFPGPPPHRYPPPPTDLLPPPYKSPFTLPPHPPIFPTLPHSSPLRLSPSPLLTPQTAAPPSPYSGLPLHQSILLPRPKLTHQNRSLPTASFPLLAPPPPPFYIYSPSAHTFLSHLLSLHLHQFFFHRKAAPSYPRTHSPPPRPALPSLTTPTYSPPGTGPRHHFLCPHPLPPPPPPLLPSVMPPTLSPTLCSPPPHTFPPLTHLPPPL